MKSLYFVRHREPAEEELRGIELSEEAPGPDYFPEEVLTGADRLDLESEHVELYQALVQLGDLLGDGSHIGLLFDKIAAHAYELGLRDAAKPTAP